MKIEINNLPGNSLKKEIKFPVLVRSLHDGALVLFENEREGTVLQTGEHGPQWATVDSSNVWQILPNEVSINLSNTQ